MVSDFCNMLIGERLIGIFRQLNLVGFEFGEYFQRKNFKGENSFASTIALHVVGGIFRIECKNKIILSYSDLLTSYEGEESDWNFPNTTRFDRVSKEIMKQYNNEIVQKVVVSPQNDIFIYTNHLCISIFVVDSGVVEYWDESWRLFKRVPESSPHLVVGGNGGTLSY